MKRIKFNTSNLTIQINEEIYNILNKYRQKGSEDTESGGILMGELYPQANTIKITNILKCNNNYADKYNIELNIKCLQEQMDKLWEKSGGSITYLGDWHTHPEFDPKASLIDYKTFIKNFFGSTFDQNILIYMILGKKENNWIKSFNGFFFKNIKNVSITIDN